MPPHPDETKADEAQAAIQASMERAHELVSEAKQVILAAAQPEPQPPNPAG